MAPHTGVAFVHLLLGVAIGNLFYYGFLSLWRHITFTFAPKIVVLVIGNFQMLPDLLNCGCANSTWNVMALKKKPRRLPE